MIEKGIPRHDYPVTDITGKTIGKITSGTQSPSLSKAIGMGYIDTAYSALDTELFVKVRDKSVKAKVVKIPFQ